MLADDTLDCERAYVGLSRAEQRNWLYIVDQPDERADERHAPEPVSDAVAGARKMLARSLAKSMAVERAPSAPILIMGLGFEM